MKPDDPTLQTRWTMVARLKNLDDQQSWREFYELYRKLIVGVAVKAGLRRDEAEEVLQETMKGVSHGIGSFAADGKRGSFHAWLLTRTKWRIVEQFRKRSPAHGNGGHHQESTTPAVERVPDERAEDLERLCDAEWKARLMDQALQELQIEVKAEHYQIFYLLAVEQKSNSDVAKMVGRTRAEIYVIKHRVSNALKRIVARLEKRLG